MKLERWRGQSLWTNGKSRQPNPNAWKEHGVGENIDAEEIDEHCGMADPGCCYLGVIPCQRLGFGESGSDFAPAFQRPLTEKVTQPAPYTRAV